MFKLWDRDGLTFFGFVSAIILAIASAGFAIDKVVQWQCHNYQEMTGKEVKYINFDACYVNTGSGWVRYDSNTRKNFNGEL